MTEQDRSRDGIGPEDAVDAEAGGPGSETAAHLGRWVREPGPDGEAAASDPDATPEGEPDTDIPAFLRRQSKPRTLKIRPDGRFTLPPRETSSPRRRSHGEPDAYWSSSARLALDEMLAEVDRAAEPEPAMPEHLYLTGPRRRRGWRRPAIWFALVAAGSVSAWQFGNANVSQLAGSVFERVDIMLAGEPRRWAEAALASEPVRSANAGQAVGTGSRQAAPAAFAGAVGAARAEVPAATPGQPETVLRVEPVRQVMPAGLAARPQGGGQNIPARELRIAPSGGEGVVLLPSGAGAAPAPGARDVPASRRVASTAPDVVALALPDRFGPRRPAAMDESPARPADPQTATPRLDDAETQAHLERAEALLMDGDVVAARLLYELVARQGSAQGAYGAARSYDPICFGKLGVRGVIPDPEKARQWYETAAEAGHSEAAADLRTLNGWMDRKTKTSRAGG